MNKKHFPLSSIKNSMKKLFLGIKAVAAVFVGILLLTWLSPFAQVDAGHRGVVFDRLKGGVQPETLPEGMHFRIPFFQSVVSIPVRTQKIVFTSPQNANSNIVSSQVMSSQLTYEKLSLGTDSEQRYGRMMAASSDLQDVFVDVVVTYHLEPDAVARIYQEVGLDYEAKNVVPQAIDAVKTHVAKFKVADILTKREEIKEAVFESLTASLAQDSIVLEDINLTNFDFNPQFKDAIEQKQIAEQKAQREQYLLQQKEIQVQQQIKEAEAKKEAVLLEGEGIAGYNERVQSSITPELLQYKQLENVRLTIEQWNGRYPTTYFGGGDSPIPLIALPEATTGAEENVRINVTPEQE